MQLYSIYDKKAEIYGPLFAADNEGVAYRMTQLMQSNETLLAQHPQDFALYRLATWDPHTGKLELPENPAAQYIAELENFDGSGRNLKEVTA